MLEPIYAPSDQPTFGRIAAFDIPPDGRLWGPWHVLSASLLPIGEGVEHEAFDVTACGITLPWFEVAHSPTIFGLAPVCGDCFSAA